jgi:hypothetical protein
MRVARLRGSWRSQRPAKWASRLAPTRSRAFVPPAFPRSAPRSAAVLAEIGQRVVQYLIGPLGALRSFAKHLPHKQ